MSEVANFLLARIADDEAEALRWPTDGNWGLHSPGVMWMDPDGRPIYAPRDRVLAECAAKRQVVDRAVLVANFVADPEAPEATNRVRGTRDGLAAAVAFLAASYAGHPDYRQEWKP